MRSFASSTFLAIALLCAAATSVATSIGSWSNTYLSLTMTLRDTAGFADIQASLLQGATGWYAFGIGQGMTNAQIIVMWINSDGSATVSLRNPSPHVMPMPSPDQSSITNITTSSGTIHFTMPLSSSGYSLSSQSKYFIWAHSSQAPSTNNPTSTIIRHNAAGTFTPIFTTAASTTSGSTPTGSNPGPGSTPGSTPGSSTPGSSDDNGGDSLVFPYDTFVITHAALGFAAWAVFAPLSIFIARFGRSLNKWVPLHYSIHVVGVALLTTAVFIIGYIQCQGDHFDTVHKNVGLTIFIAMYLQIFLGWLIHHLFNPERTHRPIRNHLHRVFGASLLILGLVQIYLGFGEYGVVSMPVQIAYYCWVGLLVLAFVGLSVFFWRRKVYKTPGTDDAEDGGAQTGSRSFGRRPSRNGVQDDNIRETSRLSATSEKFANS